MHFMQESRLKLKTSASPVMYHVCYRSIRAPTSPVEFNFKFFYRRLNFIWRFSARAVQLFMCQVRRWTTFLSAGHFLHLILDGQISNIQSESAAANCPPIAPIFCQTHECFRCAFVNCIMVHASIYPLTNYIILLFFSISCFRIYLVFCRTRDQND